MAAGVPEAAAGDGVRRPARPGPAPVPGPRELRWGDVHVRVEQLAGADARRVFVLVHGAGLSARYFRRVAARLRSAGDVLLLDLPGAPGLPAPRRPLSVAGQAAVVHRAVRASGGGEVVLVGQSMGAQVVVEMMARWPGSYRAGVLVGPPVNAAERTLPRQVLRYLQTALHEPARMWQVAVTDYARTTPRWLLGMVTAMLAYPIEARVAGMAAGADLVLLRGAADRLVPAPWVDELVSRSAARAEARTVPDGAHTLLLDHPGAVVAAAAGLARGLPAAVGDARGVPAVVGNDDAAAADLAHGVPAAAGNDDGDAAAPPRGRSAAGRLP
ncbi:alpha/beta hydrolase [Georgenia sp. TF02-10]|uniref:alpha/beta fold hydrolase n=1 Tax=Georgenia sp. TF02-10 TaxID=2917725 RepID=UPI001FA6D78E|nr:alpha/beta fold hydrolase [Georgenia sp. TF02-10]UNX54388.1 alpha/beta hydrolase [Georgenia sp. TF02-10]